MNIYSFLILNIFTNSSTNTEEWIILILGICLFIFSLIIFRLYRTRSKAYHELKNLHRELTINHRDLEERVQARTNIVEKQNQKLKDTETKLKALLNSTTEIHCLIDNNFKVLSFNQRASEEASKMLKKTLQVGNNVLDYVGDDWKENTEKLLKSVLEGQIHIFERELEFSENQRYWYNIEIHPVINYEDKIVGIAINANEITEQKKNLLFIQEQNDKLIQIAWVNSHDIRRPLASLLGLINLMDETNPTPKEIVEISQLIKESAKELDYIIHKVVEATYDYHELENEKITRIARENSHV